MLNQRLAPDPRACLFPTTNGLMCLFRGGVHDVDRHSHRICDHDRTVCGLTLDCRGAGIGVRFWTSVAFGQKFLLQTGDQVTVFCMYKRDRPQLTAARKACVHLIIIHHQCALVGHEMLECVHPTVNANGHLRPDFL